MRRRVDFRCDANVVEAADAEVLDADEIEGSAIRRGDDVPVDEHGLDAVVRCPDPLA